MVRETYDAGSALALPPGVTPEDFYAELLAGAEEAVMHLERGIRATFGVSVLESLVTPLGGDWAGLIRAQIAWRAAAEANQQIAHNYRQGTQTMSGWAGPAAAAYQARVTSMAEQFDAYAEGCLMLSKVTESVLEVAKGTCSLVASEVHVIAELIERTLIEASVPEDRWTGTEVDMRAVARDFWRHYGRGIDALRELAQASRSSAGAIESVTSLLEQINDSLVALGSSGAVRPGAGGTPAP